MIGGDTKIVPQNVFYENSYHGVGISDIDAYKHIASL
jgi:hypothetical protein